MNITIGGDFESKSVADLQEVGLYNYARHPTTDVWCFAYLVEDEPQPRIWHPGADDDVLYPLFDGLAAGATFRAWNAQFEVEIWNEVCSKKYGWPLLKIEQVRCTMAAAYAMALPGALEKAAIALGLSEQKDMKGHRLMLQMCRPRSLNPLVWWDAEDKQLALRAYCGQDTITERAVSKKILPLSPEEQEMWLIDQRINRRGVRIDRPAVVRALEVIDLERERLNADMKRVTNGWVSAYTNVNELTRFIRLEGIDTDGVAKADVQRILARNDIPGSVRSALEIRQEAGKASLAKLERMLEVVSDDGRVRNTTQYHAAATGRWGGRNLQVHNFPRGVLSPEDVAKILNALTSSKTAREAADYITMFFDSALTALVSCLRGFIIPDPGKDIANADYANIEGRVLAWLAGEQWKLDAFAEIDNSLIIDANTGKPVRDKKGEKQYTMPDMYRRSFARAFSKPVEEVTKADRQVGKVMELAFGFQGGLGAWRTMEKPYPDLPRFKDDEVEEIKSAWRNAHPAIVDYWYALERAALAAVKYPGTKASAGAEGRQVTYKVSGSFLWCQLPSKRVLCYAFPSIGQQAWVSFATEKKTFSTSMFARTFADLEKKAAAYAEKNKLRLVEIGGSKDVVVFMGVDSTTKQWVLQALYGGLQAENNTQAVAADILRHGIRSLETHDYPVSLHCHDEANAELPAGTGDPDEMERIMCLAPAWAKGLPIVAEGWIAGRYRK